MTANLEAETRAPAERADTLIAFFDLHTRSHHADEHGWFWIACGCGWGGTDGHLNPSQWLAHRRGELASVLASLADDRLAEAEAKARELDEALEQAVQSMSDLGGELLEAEKRAQNAAVEAIEELQREVYNGAPDPFQEFYDFGVGQWLQERAFAKRAALSGGDAA